MHNVYLEVVEKARRNGERGELTNERSAIAGVEYSRGAVSLTRDD